MAVVIHPAIVVAQRRAVAVGILDEALGASAARVDELLLGAGGRTAGLRLEIVHRGCTATAGTSVASLGACGRSGLPGMFEPRGRLDPSDLMRGEDAVWQTNQLIP